MPPIPLDHNYLLPTTFAQHLYQEVKDLPIVDYFSRLSLDHLQKKDSFHTLQELWMESDPLKERLLKGTFPEKLLPNWADQLSCLTLHPAYSLTQLELSKWWGIEEFLTPESAGRIKESMDDKMKSGTYTPSFFIHHSHVKELHVLTDIFEEFPSPQAFDHLGVSVYPIFAPVQTLIVDDPDRFNAYLDRLSATTGFQLEHYADLLNALVHCMDTLHERGCRLAHHRLELMYAEDFLQEDVNFVFHKIRLGHDLLPIEKAMYRSALLHHLSEMYHERGWTQQFYLGTIRQFRGQESGFDAMGDDETAWYLLRYLHNLTERNKFPKTIFHHPYKSRLIASIASRFNSRLEEGWIQVRPGWELMNHQDQLEREMMEINFPGMFAQFSGIPSSAHVLPSLARHDYVKRKLCSALAAQAAHGILPESTQTLLPQLKAMLGHSPMNKG